METFMSTRVYRQAARAVATQDTEESILAAFRDLLNESWFDEITLDDVALRANTTRQTVIRRFGAKSGLLAAFTKRIAIEITTRRASAPSDDVDGAVAVLIEDYEATGDMVVRLLSLEGRIAEIEPMLEIGRSEHRRWVESTFASRLSVFAGKEREDRLSQLLIATDVWVWVLLRRTQERTPVETARLTADMINRILKQ
jgi:AcrR family transcriptional regulator